MKKILLFLIAVFITSGVQSQGKPFWNEIPSFRYQDSIQKPQDGMLLFIGSSSFRLWKTIKQDLHNENILNRAFGGSTLKDVIAYQDDVVLKYKPKKIFIYCGENDIASSELITPEIVFERFKTLYANIRKEFPEIPIVYVSIKPCVLRWNMKDRMMATNSLIREYIDKEKNIVFVDIWNRMLENGVPIKDIFIGDNLHMNAKGYAIWAKELEPFVND